MLADMVRLQAVSQLAALLTRRAARGGLDLAYPGRCCGCDKELGESETRGSLCSACATSLATRDGSLCRRCGATLADDGPPVDDCRFCRGHRLGFDAVIALGRYDGVLRRMVLKTKRQTHESISTALGHLLADRRREPLAALEATLVVPIPMHWWRYLLRGTNSPEILAGCLGRQFHLPVARVLSRCRHTAPQKDLLPRQRFLNMAGAFRIRRGQTGRLTGSHILLVDDILTTGATCSEAARVLKRAGAARVTAVVLARAQGSGH
jgi:ComF family protein